MAYAIFVRGVWGHRRQLYKIDASSILQDVDRGPNIKGEEQAGEDNSLF